MSKNIGWSTVKIPKPPVLFFWPSLQMQILSQLVQLYPDDWGRNILQRFGDVRIRQSWPASPCCNVFCPTGICELHQAEYKVWNASVVQ